MSIRRLPTVATLELSKVGSAFEFTSVAALWNTAATCCGRTVIDPDAAVLLSLKV